MIEYFKPSWNFKFENSSFLVVVEKSKSSWKIRVNFGLMEFERFYWSIKRVEFSCHVSFLAGNFLGL